MTFCTDLHGPRFMKPNKPSILLVDVSACIRALWTKRYLSVRIIPIWYKKMKIKVVTNDGVYFIGLSQ